ncbi:MAG: site-2 protease family protein [Porcipelethomonas sp.]
MDTEKMLEIFTKVLIIFLILPVHEYAHAWAAHKMGDDTAAYSGRLTLNPLAHVDIFGAVCLLFTGFGWAKPVPINPLKFRKQRAGVAITAAAGPASNLVFAFIAAFAYRIVVCLPAFSDIIAPLYTRYIDIDEVRNCALTGSSLVYSAAGANGMFFLLYILECFIIINIGLALFNLIPIPPLDGSKILGYFTSAKFDRMIEQYQMIISIAFMAIVLSGILGTPLGWVRERVVEFFWLITGFIPKLMGV